MAWTDFKFTPEDGLSNTTTFPSKPASGVAARAQFMTILNQIKAFLNGGVKDYVDEHKADNANLIEVHGIKIESGTWTPVLAGSTVAGTNAYHTQIGRFTKINKQVFFDLRIHLSTKDVAMAGGLRITGLPYPTANIANYRVSFPIGILNSVEYGEYKQILAVSNENLSAILLNKTQGTADLSQTVLLPADIGDGFFIAISGTYLTN